MFIKIKLILKLIKYNKRRILSKLIHRSTLLFTLLQIAEGIIKSRFNDSINFNLSTSIYIYMLLTIAITYVEIKSILNSKYKIDDGITIEIAIGDYIDNIELYKNSICVFGVDNRFIMDHSQAVKGSIYCDFLKKYYSKNKEDIQSKVDDYLLKHYNIDNRFLNGFDRKRIPYGKIVNLELDNLSNKDYKLRNFIMISTSELYKSRGAKIEDLTINYPLEVLKFIDTNKIQGREVLFPLIGSNTAFMDFKHNDIAKYLVDIFFDNLHKNNIKRFIISIRDKDYINGDINVDELSKYIESKIIIYKSKHKLSYNN